MENDTPSDLAITPAFTKLQRAIVTSSIWMEDNETRLVWITLLALCDRDGIARCSPRGLAHQARVSEAGCERAIEILSKPDPDSRDQSDDGRRIERVNAGFYVINYKKKLQEGITSAKREYNRIKKQESRERLAKKAANGGTIRPEHLRSNSGPHIHGPNGSRGL
jgi:hypothetical protein